VKDLVEIPDNVKNKLELIPVKWIDRVLEVALERIPEPLPQAEGGGDLPQSVDEQTRSGVVKH
jgi:ATP-dependent Lon protease